MKIITTGLLFIMLTSCASKFDQYRKVTDYNSFKCQQLCSTGNVAQIQNFGCACRYQNKSGTNLNNASGNIVNVYTGAQNSRSNASESGWGKILGTLIQNEREATQRTQDTLNNWGGGRINSGNQINKGYQNVVPQNNVFGVIGE